jgi:hypothetical protein
MKLTFRKLFCVPAFAAALACSRSTFAGDTDKNVTAENTTAAIEQQPFQLSAEFDVEQAYVGEGEVERGSRSVDNIDEYYSLARFVLTPRIPFGILRLGAEWERYSFGFSNGEQLPNTDWVAENHWCVPLYYRPDAVPLEQLEPEGAIG